MSVKLQGTFLIFIAALFYFLWLSEILPATIKQKIPQSLIESGLFINPVHVLDLSLYLPGLIITAILLQKRKPIALLLAPLALVFCTLMDINIGVLVIIMEKNGIGNSFPIAELMGTLTVISIALLYHFFRHLKKSKMEI